MNILYKISVVFIYIVSIFGAIDIIYDGIKPTANTILFIFALLSFVIQLFYNKRLLLVDIMVFIFALLSALSFSLFISDLFLHPVAVAVNCEGHKPSRTHYLDIMVIGFLVTFALGLIFIKNHTHKTIVDRLFSFIFISILLLSYSEIAFIKTLNGTIDEVSKPIRVLPKGC